MLQPAYLGIFSDDIIKLYWKLEDDIIADISRRIAKDLKLTSTADYQISQLVNMGYPLQDIKEEIAYTMKIATSEVGELIKDSAYLAHKNDQTLYAKGGKQLPDLGEAMIANIKATAKKTQYDFKNITQSMAIAQTGSTGKLDFVKKYQETLNYATIQMQSGAFTYNEAVKSAVKTFVDLGITDVHYASGAKSKIDVAVRRAVLTNTSQISGLISEKNAEDMGQDLMEITSHIGARPDHAEWQGEIVSRSGASGYLSLTDIGYQDVTGFKGINCAHDWYPFFEGISVRQEKAVEPEPVEYNGREYTEYEASQKQRYHERKIRDTKRELEAYKGAGLEGEKQMAQIKLARQQAEYSKFSNAMGLRPKNERTGIVTRSMGTTPAKLPTPKAKPKVPTLPPKVADTRKYKSIKEAYKEVNLGAIEKDFAKQIETRLLDLQNKYPINTDLKILSTTDNGVFGFSRSGIQYENGKLKFIDEIRYNEDLMRNEATSKLYHSRNATNTGLPTHSALSTIDHEFAHAIDNYYKYENRLDLKVIKDMFEQERKANSMYISMVNQVNKETGLQADFLSTKLHAQMRKDYGLSVREMDNLIEKEFGTYARTNKKEFLAEGFSVIRHVPESEWTDFTRNFSARFNLLFDTLRR